jgi:hypothetical protein
MFVRLSDRGIAITDCYRSGVITLGRTVGNIWYDVRSE